MSAVAIARPIISKTIPNAITAIRISAEAKTGIRSSIWSLVRADKISDIEKLIDDIEAKLHNMLEREVTSERIGEMVMERLKDLDDIAYVRFASVYRQFKDINSFMSELAKIIKKA
jgi:transcriptional regulator NrdR family protein